MASVMGIFEVGYGGVEASNHLRFSQAKNVDTAQDVAVRETAGDLADSILKVTPNSIFVADYDSAAKLFSLKYGQGTVRNISADNDNKITPGLAQAFNHSKLWASNVFNPAAFGGVTSIATRKPSMAPTLAMAA